MPSKKPAENKELQKDSNILAAISYLNLLVAVILYLIKKDDKFVRFHAMQSILFEVAYTVIFLILWVVAVFSIFTFWLAFIVIPLIFVFAGIAFLVMIYIAYKAFKGEKYKLPVLGEYAEKYSS